MTSPAEFYGFWGATTINPFLGEVEIMNVGLVRLKDYTQDLSLNRPGWPPWVPTAPEASGSAGTAMLLRLRDGIERFLITDINSPAAGASAQSAIPVMWDGFGSSAFDDNTAGTAIFNHVPTGGNVLYMDGHVQFIRYPQQFPYLDEEQLLKESSHYGLG